MDHSLLWIVLSLTTQHNNNANNATGCPAPPGRAPAFSAEESLGQTCPSGDAVALSYRRNLPVSRHSPWHDGLCACKMHKHAESGMSPEMHTDPCSTRNKYAPKSLV